jgi:ABC transport system ATP-binding/permease protein
MACTNSLCILSMSANYLSYWSFRNHLSLEGIEFLEEALQEPSLTCLCISHDRYFVDVFAQDIWELDGVLHRYGAGYADFLTQKAARIESEKKEHENLLRTYKKELAWVRKQPRARGTKAKYRVESFAALESKLNIKKEVSEVRSLKTAETRLGGNVISLTNVTLYRGNVLVVKDFTYEFQRGERVGICGGNGVGKSSLLRAILGQIPVQSGTIEVGETVAFGHFDQNGLDLPEDKRVMEYVQDVLSLAGGSSVSKKPSSSQSSAATGDAFEIQINKEIENLSYSAVVPSRPVENMNPLLRMTPVGLLDQFGFSRSQQHSFINTLSGGERRRLQLLSLLLSNPNCMLLDECSNDIDIRTLSMLEDVLDEFTGVLVLVSHDRFMLDRLVDRLIVLEGDGSVSIVEGRFTDYLAAKREQEQEKKRLNRSKTSKTAPFAAETDGPNQRKPTKMTYKERKEYESLEKDIAKAEALHTELTIKLENEAVSAGFSHLAEMTAELARLSSEVEAKTERWMVLAERADIM